MKKVFKRIGITLLVLLGLSYIVYQVFLMTQNSLTTETAIRMTVSDVIEGQGVAFRNETVLDTQRHDTVVYQVDAGGKIAKGAVVAQIYASAEDAVVQEKIETLNQRLELLKSVQNSGGTSHLQADTVQDQILYDITTLKTSLTKNVFSVSDTSDTLLIDLLKKNMLSDETIDLSAMITDLESEISTLKAQLTGDVQKVETPLAGYFVSSVDGLEDSCSVDKMKSYSAQELLSLAEKQTEDSSSIGKIITSYEWYYAAVVNSDKAKNLTVGDSVKISFSFTEVTDIPAVVTGIKEDKDGQSIVYIKSTNMSAPISNIRAQDIKIETNTYTGIRVPIKAVHVVDGVKGVYTILNNVVQFKELDILYENESYIISAPGASGTPYLRVYDEIIVEGRDLYDGKII